MDKYNQGLLMMCVSFILFIGLVIFYEIKMYQLCLESGASVEYCEEI